MRAVVRCRGFTLVEISLAILIIAILMTSLLFPLQTQVDQRKVDETKLLLEHAREALVTFAAEFGYFPCPASDTSAGLEPTAGVNHATGACPSYHGFLPARLLGLTPLDPEGYVVDSWGARANRVRYAIASDTIAGVAAPFTRSGGMAAAGAPAVAAATNLFHICGSGSGVTAGVNCGVAQTLASNAVVVLWSVGPNGAGGGTGIHESENPSPTGGSSDRIFVTRPRSTTVGAEFDDVVLWLAAPLVVNRLVNAGKLP